MIFSELFIEVIMSYNLPMVTHSYFYFCKFLYPFFLQLIWDWNDSQQVCVNRSENSNACKWMICNVFFFVIKIEPSIHCVHGIGLSTTHLVSYTFPFVRLNRIVLFLVLLEQKVCLFHLKLYYWDKRLSAAFLLLILRFEY